MFTLLFKQNSYFSAQKRLKFQIEITKTCFNHVETFFRSLWEAKHFHDIIISLFLLALKL